MAFEKHGEIRPGYTPPETDDEKSASTEALEQHLSKRLADAAFAAKVNPARVLQETPSSN